MQIPFEFRRMVERAVRAMFATWQGWTPAVTQGGSVAATAQYARYLQIGKLVIAITRLQVTAAGTAGQPVAVSLPVAASYVTADVGAGHIYGSVANQNLVVAVQTLTATTVALVHNAGTGYYTTALANGDYVLFGIQYEAA